MNWWLRTWGPSLLSPCIPSSCSGRASPVSQSREQGQSLGNEFMRKARRHGWNGVRPRPAGLSPRAGTSFILVLPRAVSRVSSGVGRDPLGPDRGWTRSGKPEARKTAGAEVQGTYRRAISLAHPFLGLHSDPQIKTLVCLPHFPSSPSTPSLEQNSQPFPTHQHFENTKILRT